MTATEIPVPLSNGGRLFSPVRLVRGLYGRLSEKPEVDCGHIVGQRKGSTDPQMISTCCGKWLEHELWELLSEEERMEARKAALRRFWSHT